MTLSKTWVLLVVMLVSGIAGCGDREKQAIAKIEELGGSVRVNESTNRTEVDLSGTNVTDAGLEHLKGLTSLQELYLDGTEVTDAGLVHLKGLTSLRRLLLSDTKVTDAGLVHLKGLTSLQALNLRYTKVTDAGVKKLQQALPNCKISR